MKKKEIKKLIKEINKLLRPLEESTNLEMIENYSKILREKTGFGKVPTSIGHLAEAFGIKFEHVEMEDEILGVLEYNRKFKKTYKTDKLVKINKNLSLGNQRVIIAYFLGIYIMNYKKKKYKNILKNDGRDNILAYYFALSLILPKRELLEKLNELKEMGYDDNKCLNSLSKKFLVSENGISQRLSRLQYPYLF